MFVRLVTYDNILLMMPYDHFPKIMFKVFLFVSMRSSHDIEGELQPSRREYEATSCFHQRGVVGFRRCPNTLDRVGCVRE